ncbi:MAG TPA: AMP-binding protein [Acidimicrobiales bacterium]|nr:AMP-binding protein [Acidimicrobiales bacterium]
MYRAVPPDLARAYREAGWWDDATLASTLAETLGTAAGLAFRIWSSERPYRGRLGQVADAARRLAGGLAENGIRPGDAVVLQLPNWAEAAVALWGAALAGCVLVPVAHTYGPKELGFILEACGARALLTAGRFGRLDYSAALADHRRRCPGLEVVAVVGEASFDDLIAGPASTAPAGPDPDAPAVIAFTSGTTAEPKGVVHTHRTLLAELRQISALATPAASRPRLIGSPVGHVTGMLGGLMMPVMQGEPINLIDRWEPPVVLDALIEADLSAGGGATYFLTSLLDSPDFGPRHLAHLTHLTLGGAPIPASVAERAHALGISLTRAYGSTEHPSTTAGNHDDPPERRVQTDGRPLPGVEIRLDQQGQIWSRGPDLCAGYTDPALTRETFDADGWYATGDIGVLDPDGYLTITDRLKDVIIRGGENISAAEVEQALSAMPELAEVAVVAAPDSRFGEHACAFVRVRPGSEAPDLQAVRAALDAAGLGRQKWPEELRYVDDFERTPSGKVKKFVLRRLLAPPLKPPDTPANRTWSRP